MVMVKMAKVKPSAIIPTKESENSGYDIYACFEENSLEIPAHKTVLVPTGIASAVAPGWGFRIEERGSTGSIGMKKSAGVIDSGYRGEWFIAITNTNDIPIIITKDIEKTEKNDCVIKYPYSKAIAQAILEEIPEVYIEEISYEELKTIPSKRKDGKIGSSNK